jgi:hydroxymethylbilane synthase
MIPPLRIGTRGSPLALWQAEYVAGRLGPLAGPRPVELVQIETSGDVVRDLPLSQIGGDGVFTKEIQRALLSNIVDVAVHSLKDLPTTHVEGLTLGAVPPRGATGDVFVSRRHARFDELPHGAVVATGSLRRRAQALHRRSDLKITAIRGNVGTRLQKLDEQNLDAIILAQAGLERLGLATHITEILDPLWMLPAVGQGALGLECRSDDSATLTILSQLNDAPTREAVLAERALLRGLGGGCLVPIGAQARVHGDRLAIRAAVLAPDGSRRVADKAEGPAADAERIGQALAERMLEQGARELLAIQR